MLQKIKNSFQNFGDRNALCIEDKFLTYKQLAQKTLAIVQKIQQITLERQQIIGVLINNNLSTYASILATWFSGNIFVPINPLHPQKRNLDILEQTNMKYLLTSQKESGKEFSQIETLIYTEDLFSEETLFPEIEYHTNDYLYILFTSGSTGKPKGVPVSLKNISSFIENFLSVGFQINETDKFLEIFDLTFDASVHCYALPFSLGGCVYPVSPQKIKYLDAYRILEKHEITFAKITPSTLAYLRPFFQKINLPHLKYSLFGAEAFHASIADEWQKCVPNAKIYNVYGPTEATINTFAYEKPAVGYKSFNGVVSIGKTFGNNVAVVINENQQLVGNNVKGELCLGGHQVVDKYWKLPEKTNSQFIDIEVNGKIQKFYKTGDIVFTDNEGDTFFVGRIDEQVQINGYRVELGEVENAAKQIFTGRNVVAVTKPDKNFVPLIYLFVEASENEFSVPTNQFLQILPPYMCPYKILYLQEFPKAAGGKISKSEIKNILNNITD